MQRESVQQYEAQYYAAYAQELKERFSEGLLAELTPYAQFVVWRNEVHEGKAKKPPYSPRNHRYADVANPNSWGTLDQALKALQSGRYNGIGFVCSDQDPFVMIDLDHCVGNNRSIDAWARAIITQQDTYTEYSPRDGIHLITKATLPGPGRKIGSIEMYDTHHFITLTTRHVPGTPTIIQHHQAALTDLYEGIVPSAVKNTRGVAVAPPHWQIAKPEATAESDADARVIADALKNPFFGERFRRYWEGDQTLWTGDGGTRERSSKSEADFTLCLLLLTNTKGNVEQTKRLFRQSGLYDPEKSDRISGRDPQTGKQITYVEMTIYNALRKRSQRNHPGSSGKK